MTFELRFSVALQGMLEKLVEYTDIAKSVKEHYEKTFEAHFPDDDHSLGEIMGDDRAIEYTEANILYLRISGLKTRLFSYAGGFDTESDPHPDDLLTERMALLEHGESIAIDLGLVHPRQYVEETNAILRDGELREQVPRFRDLVVDIKQEQDEAYRVLRKYLPTEIGSTDKFQIVAGDPNRYDQAFLKSIDGLYEASDMLRVCSTIHKNANEQTPVLISMLGAMNRISFPLPPNRL
tara:strand:- start:1466 stop:2176 length:711 start_codon:yes stop_codon:yes gene_type:complete